MKNKICIFIFFIAFNAWANNDINAPAGLQWGESGQDLIQKYSAKKVQTDGALDLYEIIQTPMPLSGISEIYSAVDKKYGLVRVALIEIFRNDVYGIDGVDSYNKFKKLLGDKYGKPESYEYSGRAVYKNKSEFYECLAYEGCGGYSSFFPSVNGNGVYIQLLGHKRGSGELRIIYESKDLKKAQDELESLSVERNKTAL